MRCPVALSPAADQGDGYRLSVGATHARLLIEDRAIHAAATVIVVRNADRDPSVLVGQRASGAAFMADKVVFPGGRIDHEDSGDLLVVGLSQPCRERLNEAGSPTPERIAAAAIRELWEETGQILGQAACWPDPPPAWERFAARGYRPDASGLRFVFRAITPPKRPRRFDARFFVVDAERLATDPDDFSSAEDELRFLQWMPIAEARSFDLPFITQVALAEISARLPDLSAPDRVPFFRNDVADNHIIDLAET
ncbi:NUDIX hydrolase [Palleronia sp. LCG004]|uniref:NUDIX hydrolase n=1 Tax=Palleronia sp. LCG004 TaxID=3079304 RepID=UPI002943F49C|nr:NUDIX hydrolase [Palleronia sp. LCG004]WOI55054.1 NUDIX hydrolase [Palleronia sp. LCG004]